MMNAKICGGWCGRLVDYCLSQILTKLLPLASEEKNTRAKVYRTSTHLLSWIDLCEEYENCLKQTVLNNKCLQPFRITNWNNF